VIGACSIGIAVYGNAGVDVRLRYFFRERELERVRVRDDDRDDDDDVRRREVPFLPLLELLLFRLVLVLLFLRAVPFLPPPVSLLTVDHARLSASPELTPRFL
jgi:hypothetical protein